MQPFWRAIRTAWGDEVNRHPLIQPSLPKSLRGPEQAETLQCPRQWWAAAGKPGFHPWGTKERNEEEPPGAVRGGTSDYPRVCADFTVMKEERRWGRAEKSKF